MKQTLGAYVTGDRFWDRETDLALFIERIDEGTHLLLTAQRRMGKTSLMLEAARRLSGRYISLYVDLQEAFSAADAIVELSLAVYPYKSLWDKGAGIFGGVLTSIKTAIDKISLGELSVTLRAAMSEGNWREKGDHMLSVLAASDQPVLLLLDEVPIMVNRMLKGEDYTITSDRKRQVDEFLSWVRKKSIEHHGKIRMVISGSIGFEPVLHQARLSAAMNTFQPFELKPWDETTAVACLNALAKEYGVKFKDDAQTEMVRWLGCCIPDHVQMFFSHARDHCVRSGHMEFSKQDVDEVYRTEMLGTRGHVELTHYEERLKLVLGSDLLPLALEMLTEAAATSSLTRQALSALQQDYTFADRTTAEAEEEILRVLEHDGYLHSMPKGYSFVSTLVRDWWRMRYEMFFLPVLERKGRV